MGNETKRDVFEKLTECYAEVSDAYTFETGSPYYLDDEPNYLDEYDAALPDDLPVIPEAVGNAIADYRKIFGVKVGLVNLLSDLLEPWRIGVGKSVSNIGEEARHHCLVNSNLVAKAWVLGVWRVAETGEIVKLEEEK
ncbi:hypothetical protein NNA34_14200 [Lacticaseibacillus paracasei]|uniref:hypothetical protein n=1 Tax=Lacticaseibacillus paracasei TaxID=1597 RepID=UPI002874F139|nr:hypothetical protein [Lacticaseibacillus paracasei]MDS0491418.1 hypothetical protein [Lacticaseibacillus paracasei]